MYREKYLILIHLGLLGRNRICGNSLHFVFVFFKSTVNCRCQVVLPLMEADIVDVMEAVVDGKIGQLKAALPTPSANAAAVCVVLASQGYPGPYETGMEITGLESFDGERGALAFHAGTALKEGRLVTTGGRVVGITAVAGDPEGTLGHPSPSRCP